MFEHVMAGLLAPVEAAGLLAPVEAAEVSAAAVLGGAPAPVEKISAARAVLARAELAAGLHTRLTGPGLGGAADGISLPAGLDALFPGGLVPGSVLAVQGSSSLLHTLTAASMGEAGWAAVVGGRDIGWLAAAEAGMDPARVVSIPKPGPAAADVVAACVDGFGVVVVGDMDLGAGACRSLTGRVRSKGAVLLATGSWPGAAVVRARVRGAEIGPDGLTERTLTVTREGMPTTVVLRMGTVARPDPEHVAAAAERRHLQAVS
nr:hypothetical protein [Actinomycetales bacterium]